MSEIDKKTPPQNGVPEPERAVERAEATASESPAEAGGTAEWGALRAEAEQLRAELDDTRDRLLRQAAEFQNYRKRTTQERDTLVDLGKVLVIERMLEIKDDLDRTIEAARESDGEEDATGAFSALKQGVELVHRKFSDELTRLGVEPIEAEGQPFDENLHDAMMRQPAPEGMPINTVLTEIQKGYRMGDRILRHSKVIVASEAEA